MEAEYPDKRITGLQYHMRKRLITGCVAGLIGMLMVLTVSQSPLEAQLRSRGVQPIGECAIPEDKRPWAGIPWLVGTVLAAGTVVVALKPAKRSHLD